MSARQSEPRQFCVRCGLRIYQDARKVWLHHGSNLAVSEGTIPPHNATPAPPSAAPPPADVPHQVVEHVQGDYTEFRERHKIKSGESLSFYQWLDFAVEYARGCYEAGYRDAIQDGAKK